MGACVTILGIGLWLATAASAGTINRGPACLGCHRPHYRQLAVCVDCHRGNDRTDRAAIAHHNLVAGKYAAFRLPGSQTKERGERLLATFGCRRCHRIGGKGNRLATDLDPLVHSAPPRRLAEAISTPAQFMPDFHCSEPQITELINVLMAAERQTVYSSARVVEVVHFADRRGEPENVFAKRCGPCHKALSQQDGALGRGAAGPNLAGLFSPWYPQPPALHKRWTPALLQKRLHNPRAYSTTAAMQPVSLTPAEFRELLLCLGANCEATNACRSPNKQGVRLGGPLVTGYASRHLPGSDCGAILR